MRYHAENLERLLAETTARAVSMSQHVPPETVCGDLQQSRDKWLTMERLVAEARDGFRRIADDPGNACLETGYTSGHVARAFLRAHEEAFPKSDPDGLEGPPRTPEQLAANYRELNRVAPTLRERVALMAGDPPPG